ncbi:MAG: BatA and WFA domain-containing protein [Planctomycetota bacterium]|nr:BatA and WFA domain-containing protein [Planctomycetota bacterium]
MTWLTPMYGLIAASIAVPTLIILYFLKLRRRDVEISTTLLWKKAIQDLQANAPFQRLRRNILLFLQLLILGAMLVALAQPQLTSQVMTGRRHVILIDRSASMSAQDEELAGGKKASRLDVAKEQALALVESLREGGLLAKDRADQAMVIAFDSQAEIRQQLTADKAALRRAIEEITPSEAPTAIEEAIRLAKAQQRRRVVEGQEIAGLTSDEPFTIHVYSDGRIPDASRTAPGPEDHVEFHRVGTPDAANVAIVGMRAERSFDNPSRLSVFVSLINTQTLPRTVDVELLIDDAGSGIKTTTIAGASTEGVSLSAPEAARAGAREREAANAAGLAQPVAERTGRASPGVGGVVFSVDRSAGAVVQVRLRDPATGAALEADSLEMDNRGWLIVPPAKRLAVAVVSARGNLFLTSALQGLPLSRLAEFGPEEFEERAADGSLGEFDVVILDGYLPEGAKAAPQAAAPAAPAPEGDAPAAPAEASPGPEAAPPAPIDAAVPVDVLPPGRYLIFGSVPGRLGATPSGIRDLGTGGSGSIIDWRRDHPLLRAVNLDGLDIARTRKVSLEQGSPATALAFSEAGPIILDASTGEVRSVVVPFDVAESDWPFNVSFVVFMASAVNYLADDTGAGATGRTVQPGSVFSDRLPPGSTGARVQSPDEQSQVLQAAGDGRIIYGPVSRTGVYELSWSGPAGPTDLAGDGERPTRYFAANLFDPTESDIGATDVLDLASDRVAARDSGSAGATRRLWPLLLLGALLIVLVEWFVYNRKVHV